MAEAQAPSTAPKVKYLSFLSYNICRLSTKINDADFIWYVNKFDFVCLLETFVENLKTDIFYIKLFYIFCITSY